MFPDKAIPLPLRSGLQHFQQQLLRFLFLESINIPTQAGKAARIKYPAAHLEPPELARNGLCSDMVRVVIQNFLKKPVISTVFKADK